jgi:hypothetical protein
MGLFIFRALFHFFLCPRLGLWSWIKSCSTSLAALWKIPFLNPRPLTRSLQPWGWKSEPVPYKSEVMLCNAKCGSD